MNTTLPQMNPQLSNDAPFLQWASSRTQGRTTPGKGIFTGTVGFHIEAGRYEDLDAACEGAGIPLMEIRHQSGDVKRHWSLGQQLAVRPVTTGPVGSTMFRLKDGNNALRSAQAGLGLRWTTDPQGRPRSQAAVRCLLPVLMAHGYWGLVQLGVSSTMSDRLLAALIDHVRVCHAAARELGTPVFAAELHLPLGPGAEVTVGKVQQMTLVPFVSQHPKTITRDYVNQMYDPDGVGPVVEQVWDSVVSWATEYTTALPATEPPTAGPGTLDDLR